MKAGGGGYQKENINKPSNKGKMNDIICTVDIQGADEKKVKRETDDENEKLSQDYDTTEIRDWERA